MPLSSQEERCIKLTCKYLSSSIGGNWTIQTELDELHPTKPTPEVIVTNGNLTAAIEVKRLTGNSIYQEYKESLLSNQKFLAPTCGGYYTLNPPIDFRLPMDVNLRKQVKREIERVAPTLRPREASVIQVPREGHISLASKSGPPLISCMHGGPYSEVMQPLMERINGMFMLVDEGFEHSFFTDEGRVAFSDAVVSACERRLKGDASPFGWYEEWQLTRLEDEKEDKDGVWIITVTKAYDVMESVKECVHSMLTNALRKFTEKRWADLHLVVLEKSTHAPKNLVAEALSMFNPDELVQVNFILFINGNEVIPYNPTSRFFTNDVTPDLN